MAIIEKPVEYFDQDKKCIGYMVYDDALTWKEAMCFDKPRLEWFRSIF